MRRSLPACVLAIVALALPSHMVRAEDDGAVVLTPVSNWEASFDGGLCRLERAYSAGDQPHLLILEQYMPSATLSLALIGPSLSGFEKGKNTRLRFGDVTSGTELVPLVEGNREFGQIVIFNDVSLRPDGEPSPDPSGERASPVMLDIAAAQGALEISVEQARRRVTFETGHLDAAFLVLNECTAHIMRTWGFDPAVQSALKKSAFPASPKRLSSETLDAYPRLAARDLRGGTVRVAVFIDAEGVPSGCRLIVSSGHDDIDKAACKAMMKGQFLPALDTDGEPVASFWTTRVTYLPN